MAVTTPQLAQLYVGALGAGAVAVGLYACVLYQRTLALRRQQMYVDGLVRAVETMLKLRRVR